MLFNKNQGFNLCSLYMNYVLKKLFIDLKRDP